MRDDFCPEGVCDGSGWILGEDGVAQPCPCRETRAKRRKTRLMGSGVPKRFLREASYDRNPVREIDPLILTEVRHFTREIEKNVEAGKGLWFTGDVGTGKTSLAMLISKAALDAGLTVAIYSVPRLLAEIKETYDEDSTGSYMGLFRRLCAVDLLHLDDLGAERRTDWVLEQLYSIVNERWQDERSIVATTNLEYGALTEQLGTRTVSRLTDVCGGPPIPLYGRDLRRPEELPASSHT